MDHRGQGLLRGRATTRGSSCPSTSGNIRGFCRAAAAPSAWRSTDRRGLRRFRTVRGYRPVRADPGGAHASVWRAQSGSSPRLSTCRRVTREVERQFAADDQLFQKLVGHQLCSLGVIANRQRDFERRDVAEMQVRAEVRGGVGGGLVLLARSSGSAARRGNVRRQSAAARRPAGLARGNAVIDLAGATSPRCSPHVRVQAEVQAQRSHAHRRNRLEKARQQAVDLRTNRIGCVSRFRSRSCGTMQLESTAIALRRRGPPGCAWRERRGNRPSPRRRRGQRYNASSCRISVAAGEKRSRCPARAAAASSGTPAGGRCVTVVPA